MISYESLACEYFPGPGLCVNFEKRMYVLDRFQWIMYVLLVLRAFP